MLFQKLIICTYWALIAVIRLCIAKIHERPAKIPEAKFSNSHMHIAPSIFLFIEPTSRMCACILDNNRIRPYYIRDIGILSESIGSALHFFLRQFVKRNVAKKEAGKNKMLNKFQSKRKKLLKRNKKLIRKKP